MINKGNKFFIGSGFKIELLIADVLFAMTQIYMFLSNSVNFYKKLI
jgi:hypothetical protein